MLVVSHSAEETEKIGKALGSILKSGDTVLLEGDMGSGKTHFVKGIAKALGCKETVTSPTFTVMNVYPCDGKNLNHLDVYRVSDEEELLNIGFDEAVFSDDISVIEWADLIPGIIPENYTRVYFKTAGDNIRNITFDFTYSLHDEKEMKI